MYQTYILPTVMPPTELPLSRYYNYPPNKLARLGYIYHWVYEARLLNILYITQAIVLK